MNPENQQPQQPTPPTTPLQPTPTSPFQPASFPQPSASSQVINGMKPPTSANIAKQKKIALIAAIIGIVIFAIGLALGYVFAAAAFLGAYAIAVGIRSNPKPKLTITLGAIGLVLNLGLYILSFIAK